ncbi:MAG: response regulator [Marinisporobacter sp.]|nr:response regulator [Marinisporobacter sp.]
MSDDIKILMIDDNREILFALSTICEYKGWIPIIATGVEEGIIKYKEHQPDIVLIDYHMPMINGMVGVKLLRTISETVPIIVLTVEEKQEIADTFMDIGASDFALKPIKAPDLIARINVHLKLKNSIVEHNADYKQYRKGISIRTLELIENYMRELNDYTSITNISKNTGLAYQTVHRYLQHLSTCNKVVIHQDYGSIGRPKKSYKWVK